MIKAVIFDMDGLLVDSGPLWQQATSEIFSEIGVFITRKKNKDTIGLRMDALVDYWFSDCPRLYLSGAFKKDIEERIADKVIKLIKEKVVLLPGAKKTIEIFAEKNLPMAIASSSGKDIIDAVLDKVLIRKYIKSVHSAENEPFGKPHPGVYITAAKKIKIKPEHCLAFEDSLIGVLSAKSARMKCIAVPDGRIKNDKGFYIADAVIDSLKDFDLRYLKHF
jgi:HAD superfamily hydrolase (TIGR01509 family)